MGILDDAIREHLDLKRQHGARDAELREIEDEAFGSEEQPDPFAAGGEILTESPPSAGPESAPVEFAEPAGGEDPTQLVEPEGLRPTESPLDTPAEPTGPPEGVSPPEGIDQIPGQAELPGQDEIPGQESFEESLDAEPPMAEPPAPSESLEDLIAEEEPFPEDSAAVAPPPETDEDELPLDPEAPPSTPEPESSVPEPPPPPPETGPEPPGRARGRVDVPTQEHPPPGETGGLPPLPGPESRPEPLTDEPLTDDSFDDEPSAGSGGPALYDFETDEEEPYIPAPSDTDDDFEALGPAEEEAPYLDEEEPYAEEPVSDTDTETPYEEPGTAVRPALEDEEDEGGEGLWFEKGPPKDFDFDE